MKILFALLAGIFIISVNQAQTWRVLDSLCYEYGENKPDSAIILGKKAVEGCIKEKGKNSIEYAVCLDHISWAYMVSGKFIIADSLYNEAIKTCKTINQTEKAEYAEIVNNLALFYEIQGRYSEAETFLSEAKSVRIKLFGKEHPEYAQSCGNLATLYKLQGRYNESEPLLIEAKNISSKVFGKEHPEYCSICNNLAGLYEAQGRFDEAELLLVEVKNAYIKLFGKEHVSYALSCNNLAFLYTALLRYSEAESLYIEGITVYEKLFGKQHLSYARSCDNLALLYNAQARYSEAESLFLASKNTRSDKLGKYHPDYAISCNNLALLYQAQGRYSEAEVLNIETIGIFEKIYGKEHPYYARSCYNLAMVYQAQGRFDEAKTLHIETFKIKQKEIERNFQNLSETEKEQYTKANINRYVDDFFRFIWLTHVQSPTIANYAYQLAISSKGLILNSTEKIKQRILKSNNTELKNLFLEWKITRDKFNKALTLTVEQQKEKKLNADSLEKRSNELEKQLAAKSEDFAHIFAPKAISWQDIQSKLKKNETAIEIVRLKLKEDKLNNKDSIAYMAMILKKNSKYPEIIQIPNGNELEKKYLTYYRRSIMNKMQDEESYNAFWKPIENGLKGIKKVYISSEGVYHQVNIATLQNPQTKKYVFDEVQVVPVTNTKDILENKRSYNKKIVHLVGNPKYNLNIDTRDNEKPEQNRSIENLSQLEGAEKEVKKVSDLFSNAVVTIGESATEEYVKSLKNPRILHIATHGYFKKGQYQSSTQAMLNGGLLFAGVVDYDRMYLRPFDKDDGKLTAFEVMNMELDSTELVVLSACETGLGQTSKEGVYGLQRAFKVAGVQTIIMSLWKVNDEATQLLMTEFYQNWQRKGMDKRKAFESAQKDLRKQYKEPYYWGAFVMIE